MTVEQKQCLLRYLGYYTGQIDGIWGAKSRQAALDFRRDYMDAAAGDFDSAAEIQILEVISAGASPRTPTGFWQDIRYFTRAEFRCPCGRCGGFPVEPDETLVRLADNIRAHFNAPATVSSGVRCQAHNDALPGSVPNSRHIQGKAMDFSVRGVSAGAVLAYIRTLPVRYAYQIDGCFVHMDVS